MGFVNQSINITYPTVNRADALNNSRVIKDEINAIHLTHVRQWFNIPDHALNDLLIPAVINIIGYSTCSFITAYDLDRIVMVGNKSQSLFEILMDNQDQVRHIESVLKPSIIGLWQATMYQFVRNRNVMVVGDNSEVDHWAAIYFGPHNIVVAANSIFNLGSAEEAFLNPRSVDTTMWLDYHDLAHLLDVVIGGNNTTFDAIKDFTSESIFNTPQDLMHIMSADDPKSSFCLFLGLSQGLFDEALRFKGMLDGNIHHEYENVIVDHIAENIKKYLLGQKPIKILNTSYYDIPEKTFQINLQDYTRARELALIGEANLGEGKVVWLEQYMFNRSVDKSLSCIEIVESIQDQGELSYKQWRVIFRQMGIIEGIYRAVVYLSQQGERYSYGPESELLSMLPNIQR
jgi:hypothetical protein